MTDDHLRDKLGLPLPNTRSVRRPVTPFIADHLARWMGFDLGSTEGDKTALWMPPTKLGDDVISWINGMRIVADDRLPAGTARLVNPVTGQRVTIINIAPEAAAPSDQANAAKDETMCPPLLEQAKMELKDGALVRVKGHERWATGEEMIGHTGIARRIGTSDTWNILLDGGRLVGTKDGGVPFLADELEVIGPAPTLAFAIGDRVEVHSYSDDDGTGEVGWNGRQGVVTRTSTGEGGLRRYSILFDTVPRVCEPHKEAAFSERNLRPATVIEPTIGRVVIAWRPLQPLRVYAAIITDPSPSAMTDDVIELAILGGPEVCQVAMACGPRSKASACDWHWKWMDYQLGQAAKNDGEIGGLKFALGLLANKLQKVEDANSVRDEDMRRMWTALETFGGNVPRLDKRISGLEQHVNGMMGDGADVDWPAARRPIEDGDTVRINHKEVPEWHGREGVARAVENMPGHFTVSGATGLVYWPEARLELVGFKHRFVHMGDSFGKLSDFPELKTESLLDWSDPAALQIGDTVKVLDTCPWEEHRGKEARVLGFDCPTGRDLKSLVALDVMFTKDTVPLFHPEHLKLLRRGSAEPGPVDEHDAPEAVATFPGVFDTEAALAERKRSDAAYRRLRVLEIANAGREGWGVIDLIKRAQALEAWAENDDGKSDDGPSNVTEVTFDLGEELLRRANEYRWDQTDKAELPLTWGNPRPQLKSWFDYVLVKDVFGPGQADLTAPSEPYDPAETERRLRAIIEVRAEEYREGLGAGPGSWADLSSAGKVRWAQEWVSSLLNKVSASG